MRKAAVMRESENWAFESSDDVEIRRLGRESHGRSGEGGLAIESGAGEAGSGQEMGERFQVVLVTQPRTTWGQPSPAVRGSKIR